VGRALIPVLIAVLLVPAAAPAAITPGTGEAERRAQWRHAFREAKRFAGQREGRVSFALVDDTGRLRTHHGRRAYNSASVVKAMLLVAYLRQHEVRSRRLGSDERGLLGPMVVRSDNSAASRVRDIVGYDALLRLARRAGMRRFEVRPSWGDTQITAADQARLFARIDRLCPRRHRRYARRLLRDIVPRQRWGIPPALPDGARPFFKGGWREEAGGWLVHQAALVEARGRRVSIAILTDRDRTKGYGRGSIRGVARRALWPLAGR
jgi:Beta-lactamase enzyme family